VDYRFQFRRTRVPPEQQQEQLRKEQDTAQRMRGLAFGMVIPMSLVAGPLGGYFLGEWMDRSFHTQYWMPVLIILGMIAGIKMVIDMLVKLGRQ
jgi:F0F1-type ATP synthase assembly protein I